MLPRIFSRFNHGWLVYRSEFRFECLCLQAALGVCGTEGGFRQAAAATLGALRQHTATLSALLAAVVGDPLVPWSAAEGSEGSAARKVPCSNMLSTMLFFVYCLISGVGGGCVVAAACRQ